MAVTITVIYDRDEDEFFLNLFIPGEISLEIPVSREEVYVMGKTMVAAARGEITAEEN
jgi:hypothetical protein